MPIIDVTLMEGRSYEKKKAFMQELTQVAIRTLDAKPETVRVILREIDPSHFCVAGAPRGESK